MPPTTPIEAASPAFTNLLGQQPADFTFDAYQHSEPHADWALASVAFNEIFDGRFYFYWPSQWAVTEQKMAMAEVADSEGHQQNIFLAQRHHWQPRIREHLTHQKLLAFTYTPLLWPNYVHWVIVLSTNRPNTVALATAFSSGEWLVVLESVAASAEEIKRQLTVHLNSNPWYGWIQAAKAQQQNQK